MNNDVRDRMMAALDGELEATDRQEFQRMLAEDPELRKEWEAMSEVKNLTRAMTYGKPGDEVWDNYWVSTYNRIERGIGWFLASIGLLLVVGFGLWTAVSELLQAPDVPVAIRYGLPLSAVGGLVILFSVVREKWRVRKSDPFKGVQR